MDSQHILAPVKVQALVIDDIVYDKRGAIEISKDKYAANDGRWSPQVYNYEPLTFSLNPPGPKPFYGGTRDYNGFPAEQLVPDPDSWPDKPHRGVYLHWVLPAGLRSAYTPGLLDFPPLPDHWLIVRFSHRDATQKTRAWFIDGSAVVGEGEHANLIRAGTDQYTAKRAGRVVPLEEFASANWAGERETLTALGNAHTGSPTFTAFIAENRNIFSWHDKLEDLRQPNADGSVPEGTTLSYLVLGWYRDAKNEPLASPVVQVKEQRDKSDKLTGWLIDPPGWSIQANALPADLLKRRSVFHGMVAHINYWSSEGYKGQILGYPGAPTVGGVMRKDPASFKVGVGNNAEDALVSLVSSEYSGEQETSSLAKTQPNLWKALEAVMYRQTESLVRSWNVAPRDMTVHQHWFDTQDAGKIWYLRPASDKDPVFSRDPNKTAVQTAVRPTEEQLTLLKQLNEAQAAVDAANREIAALQQDLYARWWKLCAKSRGFRPKVTDEANDCSALVTRVAALRAQRDQLLEKLRPLPDQLKSKLPKEPQTLELQYDAAPRFWTPADPVIVVKNCGQPTKHQFARRLWCRLPDQIVTNAEVKVGQASVPFNTPAGVADIAAAAQKHLPACPEIIGALLNEGSIIEQAIRDLALRSFAAEKPLVDSAAWRKWTTRLENDLAWDGDPDKFPKDQITFGKPGAMNVPPQHLAQLWVEQPWSPLFIDWQITWFPTTHTPTAEDPFGPTWNFRDADFIPLDRVSIPATGFTVRGRSLLSPIDERIFQEPIDKLRELLHSRDNGAGSKDDDADFPAVVREILSRYEVVWDKTLGELGNGGLMGQALTGFHQSLLRRDVTLPRINPDPARPWIKVDAVKKLEQDVLTQLDLTNQKGLTGERLAPPTAATTAPPFSLLRSGALRVDELWLIDDFGQTADLLGLTSARSKSTGQIFHPRIRWHDDRTVIAMPPRILQPVRLNFRFVPGLGPNEKLSEPSLGPICGWIFYNPLDQALVVCDRDGQLQGHLAFVKDQSGTSVKWEAGAGGVALNAILNPTLKAFAESLETPPVANPKLLQLLNLIDNALLRIRPSNARRDTVLVGRPLALVNATLGLELFGRAWNDPKNAVAERGGTGDETLDVLRVRVALGYSQNIEDGLVGYFKAGAYNRVIATELSKEVTASDYIGDPKTNSPRVGFGPPEKITLLMDPWGSVQATCGIVPAKTITLAQAELNKIVTHMETSFRVGPVLLQADKIAMPTPAGEKGTWNFSGPLTNQTAAAVAPIDPRSYSDQPVIATEGRLLLLHED